MQRPTMKDLETSFVVSFFKLESASGIVLIISALAAIILANSPLNGYYTLLIETLVVIKIGTFEIAKPLLLWVNDGLMAVFFFMIGLELKREFIEGELSDKKNITLPALGAIGGMVVPAAIYLLFNHEDPMAAKGWAIPAATDIAFAMGVLALLGPRIPTSLKIFLMSLAIFDDVGAILIIAFFYTSKISALALAVALVCISVLFLLSRGGYFGKSLFILIGVVMWVALLKSGVHATLAGIILALFIPIKSPDNPDISPLKNLEHDIHASVAFVIVPVFAFCNSGIDLHGKGLEDLGHDVSIGIFLALFLGKQIGVFLACWLGVTLRYTRLPDDVSFSQLYGAAVLTGIGFTMSLFIGSLAFEETGVNLNFDERLGIILGSFTSGTLGYYVLRTVSR